MKYIELFEKVQRTKPKLSHFIYQKYLSDLINNPKFSDEKPDRYKNRKEYNCIIEFNFPTYLVDKESLKNLLSIVERLKDFEETNLKRVSLLIHSNIYIRIKIKPAKVKEIEETQEYQDWYKNVDADFAKYKEKFELKKAMKKYNL